MQEQRHLDLINLSLHQCLGLTAALERAALAELISSIHPCIAYRTNTLPAENPEQGEDGNWGRHIQRRPADVVARTEDRLGISIRPPVGTCRYPGDAVAPLCSICWLPCLSRRD